MRKTLQRQLQEAFERQGWTLAELKRMANLSCSEDSLSRKMRGKQSLRSTEVEAIAKALRVVVSTGMEPANEAA